MGDVFIEQLVCAYCTEKPPLYRIKGEWLACEECKQTVEQGVKDADYRVYCEIAALESGMDEDDEPLDDLAKDEIDAEVYIETVYPPSQRAKTLEEMHESFDRERDRRGYYEPEPAGN